MPETDFISAGGHRALQQQLSRLVRKINFVGAVTTRVQWEYDGPGRLTAEHQTVDGMTLSVQY